MQHKNPEYFRLIENYINEYVDENGTIPTLRDIANAVGLARSSVCNYLSEMESSGRIVYDEHRKPLTRQMLDDLRNMTRTSLREHGAPIIGTITCGKPEDQEEFIEQTVKLPKSLFGDGPLFILHASGDSMIEAGIEDGDLVVVKQQQTAEPGDIIVALTEDGTTLKGFFPEAEHHRIRLQPANSNMEPMYYDSISIQGIAVKVIKDILSM